MIDHKALNSFIRSILTERGVRADELDDVTQDTWIALLSRNAFDKAKDLRPYIARTAANTWKDHIRRDAPFQSKTEEIAKRAKKLTNRRNRIRKHDAQSLDAANYDYIAIKQPTIETQLIQREQIEIAIKEAHVHLSRRRFQVLRLKLTGHKNEEIAKATNHTKAQVEHVIRRFRKGAALCSK